MSSKRPLPMLERLEGRSGHRFAQPSKRINDRDDLRRFFTSTAYRDLTKWLLQLNRAMFPTKGDEEEPELHCLNASPSFSLHISRVRELLRDLSDLMQEAPPDTGPRRFGNVAFRKWYQLAEDVAADLLKSHLGEIVLLPSELNFQEKSPALEELRAYLMGSFGSAQRLDYGTGHELSFLAFLGCLWKLGAFKQGEESAIVIGIVQPYLELVRRLIVTYTLEPAGSHGVWGLDDHSFIPYIFGSAQLGPPILQSDYSMPVPTEGSLSTAPSPSSIIDKTRVGDYKDSNMYYSAIQFIFDVKKGPFWEHSPVLYDISGIKDGWGKINKGMLKMYAAEVLGKFPVVQHFPFGSLFEWEQDPEAQDSPMSVHAQQQPPSAQNDDAFYPSLPKGKPGPRPSTSASRQLQAWPQPSTLTLPQMQANTGMPSMRAPSASGNTQVGRRFEDVVNNPTTETSQVGSQRQPSQGIAPTAAPWAKRDPAQ